MHSVRTADLHHCLRTIETFTALPAFSRLAFRKREEVRPNSAAAIFSKLEPISNRNRGPGLFTGEHVTIRPNCFTMQTHVTIFSLAWYIFTTTPLRKKKS